MSESEKVTLTNMCMVYDEIKFSYKTRLKAVGQD